MPDLQLNQTLSALGISPQQSGCAIGATWEKTSGPEIAARSPIEGAPPPPVRWPHPADVERAVNAAHQAFLQWRSVPAPKRGEFVRRIGEKLRAHKNELGTIV